MTSTSERPIVLRPSSVRQQLTPQSPVIIIHRGGPIIEDKFDAVDWVVPPNGTYQVPYEVALHLKARNIVPGSRQAATGGKQISQIGIISTAWGVPIDRPQDCEPFTDEQVKYYWSHNEGIDRSVLLPSAQQVQTIETASVASRIAAQEMTQSQEERAALLREVPAEKNEALQEMVDAGVVVQRRAGGRR